ncbi:MAG: MerR family transcriptional regulator [Azoarcus sp.]|jgi:DNA-binding transcriptional MerR regulator|nr:MerR family transcriptional regulator [Azoarcus sp.]
MATITEIGKKFGLTADTLRYYERIGLIPAVGRGAGGIRNYTKFDCDWIDFIKCMRGAGVQVEALIEYVTLFQQGDTTADARKQILVEQRAQIAVRVDDMRKMLDRLDQKIGQYESHIMPAERKLQRKNGRMALERFDALNREAQ